MSRATDCIEYVEVQYRKQGVLVVSRCPNDQALLLRLSRWSREKVDAEVFLINSVGEKSNQVGGVFGGQWWMMVDGKIMRGC